jgi:hypothetical protein
MLSDKETSGFWKCPECDDLRELETTYCPCCKKSFCVEMYEVSWAEFWAECNELKNGC